MTKYTNPKTFNGMKKPPMSCLPMAVVMEAGVGMLEGALKYGRHNWRTSGCQASTYYDSTMRHLNEWWEGEDTDPASGLNHITKAITSLMVLRDSMIQDKFNDDRPPKTDPLFMAELRECVDMLLLDNDDRDRSEVCEHGNTMGFCEFGCVAAGQPGRCIHGVIVEPGSHCKTCAP